jgi:hypothetical protein
MIVALPPTRSPSGRRHRRRVVRHLLADEPGRLRRGENRCAVPGSGPFGTFGTFGTFGANAPAIVRAIVATFWYGAQTSAAAGAIVAFLIRYDGPNNLHATTTLFDHTGLEVICYLGVWIAQLAIISKGMETVRKFQDFAGPRSG